MADIPTFTIRVERNTMILDMEAGCPANLWEEVYKRLRGFLGEVINTRTVARADQAIRDFLTLEVLKGDLYREGQGTTHFIHPGPDRFDPSRWVYIDDKLVGPTWSVIVGQPQSLSHRHLNVHGLGCSRDHPSHLTIDIGRILDNLLRGTDRDTQVDILRQLAPILRPYAPMAADALESET